MIVWVHRGRLDLTHQVTHVVNLLQGTKHTLPETIPAKKPLEMYSSWKMIHFLLGPFRPNFRGFAVSGKDGKVSFAQIEQLLNHDALNQKVAWRVGSISIYKQPGVEL